ncbi:MAG: hypothetical protein FJ207_09485 [Gemmatimonadetes bacterium]|nr:hypothetical protein [Gemmatimonadota bacterium]
MSKRAWCCCVVAAATQLGDGTPASAQSNETEILERIERLQVEVREAGRAATDAVGRVAMEEAARTRVPTERVRVGPFDILTVADQAELAAELFEEVWREDFAGLDGSPALTSSIFTFEWWTTQPAGIYMYPVVPGEGGPAVHRIEVHRQWVPTRGGLKLAVRTAIWNAVREDLLQGTPLRAWVEAAGIMTTPDVYRSLATMTSDLGHACIGAEIRACMVGLGFQHDVTEHELTDWFDPWMRRSLVVRASAPWEARVDSNDASVRACLDADDIGACDRTLLAIDWLGIARTPREANVHLLFHAVRLGGEGAWARALENPSATPAEALARASGQDVEALVSSWRAALEQGRPVAYAGIGMHAAVVVAWILILAALAMRSTRWRPA